MYVAELFWPLLTDDERNRLRRCGRKLGERWEVDLEAVETELGEQVASAFYRQYVSCQEGKQTEVVALRRQLSMATQVTGRRGRSDLRVELTALEMIPGVRELVEELTGAAPRREVMEMLGAPFGLELSDQEELLCARFQLSSYYDFPPVLGGPATAGEVARHFCALTNYSAWRDRRARRLVQLTVEAEEAWPATVVSWR